MQSGVTTKQHGLLRIVCGLLCSLLLGLAGCGSGGSGGTSPGPDRSADFAIVLDPANKNLLLKPGQTMPVTLDLVSANGFPNPVTVSIDNVPTGWTVAFAAPTVSSLPPGVTKVVLNVTPAANAVPNVSTSAGRIKATGGGTTRYLNGAVPISPDEGGTVPTPAQKSDLTVAVAGVSLGTLEPTSFPTHAAFTAGDVNGRALLYGVGLTGPVMVTITNSTPGLTAVLDKSTFPPTNGLINESIPIHVHIDATVGPGVYPFTVTETAPDSTQTTVTIHLIVSS
ncbi:MAG: hypothetical protein JWL77_5643 [Chthonomonadaceae bacterium]|nr:hypothetical protein [Chthonomonadaceae bacterium]